MNTTHTRPARFSVWLSASAAVLVALILVQLGRSGWRGSPTSAHEAAMAGMMASDMVSRVGDYSIMSFESGPEDIVVVLDGHGEDLYAYRIKNQRSLEFLQREKLTDVFQQVKAMEANR